MPLLKFDYCYRDAANYKNFGSQLYRNPVNLDVNFILAIIRQHLIDDEWFSPEKWKVPALYFKNYDFDPSLDHGWHEFVAIYECSAFEGETLDIQVLLEAIVR